MTTATVRPNLIANKTTEEIRQVANDLAIVVTDAWKKDVEADDSKWKPAAVYASQRHKCIRQMALDLIAWDQKPSIEPGRLQRMRHGKEREKDIIGHLIQIGKTAKVPFEVIYEQAREVLRDRQGRDIIRMRIDGRLKFANGLVPPFEIKCYDLNLVDGIWTVDDFTKSPWVSHAPDQLLAYLFGYGYPFGYFVLETRGLPRLIPVLLDDHLDRVEGFLKDADTAMSAMRAYEKKGADALPPFIKDQSECRRCPHFQRACQPPILFGKGVQVFQDSELETMLKRREELQPSSSEYTRIDKKVKEVFKSIPLALCGDFEITGKMAPRKGYTVKDSESWQVNIERINGKK